MSRFGFNTQPSSGDFLPIVKYDSRAGRIFRVDRVDTGQGFASEPIDISHNFKAVFDFENIETGWIDFTAGGAPNFNMVPLDHALPAQPSPNHKNGIRFMLKLSKDCGGDKPIREIAGTAKAFLNAVEKLYGEYEAHRGDNPGKLPVVVMKGATPIKSGSGDKQSTNYVPKFEISGWAPRGDLVFTPKNASAPSAVAAAPKPASTPPSSGSTPVGAPKAKAASTVTEQELADADFG